MAILCISTPWEPPDPDLMTKQKPTANQTETQKLLDDAESSMQNPRSASSSTTWLSEGKP